MRHPLAILVVFLVPLPALLSVPFSAPLSAEVGSLEIVDRILAVVDEDPISRSDLQRAIALGSVEGSLEDAASERRALDQLIEQRLRLHEVERYDVSLVSPEAIEAQVAAIEERFGGAPALAAALAAVGLDRDALRERVRRQLRVLAYVEERLAARVFIDEVDVREHYAGAFVADLTDRGLEPPPFDAVRGEIRALLEERALAAEVAEWTEELRRRARVVDLLDRPENDEADLPPVVLRIGG